ncbi:MAG: hypothetical protein HY540_06785 [Deltaproteobacteria bacterium]|nr:hypothetical protein [Deltaproteobacteria bacterium]
MVTNENKTGISQSMTPNSAFLRLVLGCSKKNEISANKADEKAQADYRNALEEYEEKMEVWNAIQAGKLTSIDVK